MSESNLKNRVEKTLKRLRESGIPLCWRKVHGSGMQRNGEPDFDIVCCGISCRVELKDGRNRLTKLQQKRMEEWKAAGARCLVATSEFDVERLIQSVYAVEMEIPNATQ